VLAGKGGIGKTLVASLIAQAAQEQGAAVVCLDADPVNASLHRIGALNAIPIDIYRAGGDEADLDVLDAMFERMLSEEGTVVVDNGAAGFVPLSRYLMQDCLADSLAAADRQLVLHTIVAGGPEIIDTAHAFDEMAAQLPAAYPFVLWLNPHHGALSGADGTLFVDTPVVRKHRARLCGIVELPRFDRYFGKSFALMTGRRMTFAEADASDLTTIDRQRLRQIRRSLFEQITAVL
jgi:hypothetical protein